MEQTQEKFCLFFNTPFVRLDSTQFEAVFQNEDLVKEINKLGELSAQSRNFQNINKYRSTTYCEKLANSDNVLYLALDSSEDEKKYDNLIGILRVTRKELFLYNNLLIPYEGNFLCVLDFYIHHSNQKNGIGTNLFDFMMKNERVNYAYQLAFDNPSVALLGFLAKKYDLEDPIWQNTNIVVFSQLFDSIEKYASKKVLPEGWQRTTLPRRISNDKIVENTRFLNNAISGHSAARKARTQQSEDAIPLIKLPTTVTSNRAISIERTNALQMQQEARQRKQQILSSRSFW